MIDGTPSDLAWQDAMIKIDRLTAPISEDEVRLAMEAYVSSDANGEEEWIRAALEAFLRSRAPRSDKGGA